MIKKIKVDFFKVVLSEEFPHPFEYIINSVNSSPDDETRNSSRGSNPIRLHKAKQNKDSWEGELIRIRMDQLPVKANLKGNVSSIDLEEDEGIGEETAFLYHSPTKVLAIQRNRFGVSCGAFAWYFEEKTAVETIELQPVIRTDALQRLADMKDVRKLSLNIAGIEDMSVFKDLGKSVESMLGLVKEFKSPNLIFTVSMGRQQGTLHRAKEFAKRLAGLSQNGDSTIHKVEISGTNEDGEKSVLDLVEYRMFEEIEVKSQSDRTISESERNRALRKAFDLRRQELIQMFSS